MFRLLLALALLACVALTGCGGSWASASGTVTLDGANLKNGVISFHPVGGGATAYGTVTDGAFTLSTGQKSGLTPGKYKVTVSSSTVPKEGTAETAKLITPQKYSRPNTTDLTADVQSGSNSFQFDMTSK
ncbi:MAG: hypothetical protein ACRCZF_23905 [Gemmataceae bacterium]